MPCQLLALLHLTVAIGSVRAIAKASRNLKKES